jgi:hypothetical protein
MATAGDRDGDPTTIRGVSFWRLTAGAQTTEINTEDELVLAADRARWAIGPLPGNATASAIESVSPAVHSFLRRVAAEKLRLARRARPVRPPIPKPESPAPRMPRDAPVPCPLCRPNATPDYPGEPWPGCEMCDGSGAVSAHQAQGWLERGTLPGHDD